MRKKAQDNAAEIVITVIAIAMLLSSCSFNNKAEAMPPVHKLYYELSVHEKQVYNSLNAQERVNINKNTHMHQLKNALNEDFTN
tara:strand:+ start:751 stop:1002 length:252 start_codon:yes stop_codon:yes gene_type:complete